MIGHTPGPWYLDLRAGDNYNDEGSFIISAVSYNERLPLMMCKVLHDTLIGSARSKRTPQEKIEREEALHVGLCNARLAAAAPLMLEALIRIAACDDTAAVAIAKDAIAKAKGRSA
jgi:hypothetical protein